MPVSQDSRTLIRFTNVQARLLKRQDQWLMAHGISYKEFLIMLHIQEAPARHMKRIDLAEKVGLSASGVTRLLNPMEKIGLITKEEGARDARVSLVRLTESGESILKDAVKSFNEGTKGFVAALNEQQYAAFGELAQMS